MKRSTNIAPVSLSTSYLIGSAFIGISMMTLNSSGALAPGVTLCRLMVVSGFRENPNSSDASCEGLTRINAPVTDGKHHAPRVAAAPHLPVASGAGPPVLRRQPAAVRAALQIR